MKRLKKADCIIVAVIILIVASIVLAILGGKYFNSRTSEQTRDNTATVTYESFNGRRIGIRTGSSFEELSLQYFPDSEYLYFDSDSDLITALLNDKIDGFLDDEPVAELIHHEHSEISFLRERLLEDDYCFGFQKGTERSGKLRAEFNDTLQRLRESGELDYMKEKWSGSDESLKTFDNEPLSGENGKVMVCVIPDKVPFTYMHDNQITGYFIELLHIFAQEHGYSLEVELAPISGMLAGVTSGKYDIAAGTLSVTEDRKKTLDFSDVIYEGGLVLVGRTEELGTSGYGRDYISFDGKRAGIRTGSSTEPITLKYFPNSQYFYYDSDSDLITALISNKIDFFLNDEPVAALQHQQQESVDYIRTPLLDDDYSFGFQKNNPRSEMLQSQFNEFLAACKESGRLDELKKKWIDDDEADKVIDTANPSGPNGKIVVAVVPDNIPFSYMANNRLTGYAVELTLDFANEYGYSVEFEQANLSACIAGLSSGKYDILAYTLSYTEERAKNIDYSDVFYNGGVVVVARSTDINSYSAAAGKSFLVSIKESFMNNFITEARYMLILEGIGTTCLITVLSAISGTILAFFISLFRRTDSVLAGKIADFYVKLLQGTPVVVLLMILYYVVFGKSGINAIWVAVIGFSLIFAAYVSEIMRSGIESIDAGQREAALALGYSENQAFFRFIFPQAAIRQIPVYKGEIISLLKNTSVVGYIALQDLTKMSDIIRSRTYEAFFPLIATAIIYFILAWIIALLLKLLLFKLNPRSRKTKEATR